MELCATTSNIVQHPIMDEQPTSPNGHEQSSPCPKLVQQNDPREHGTNRTKPMTKLGNAQVFQLQQSWSYCDSMPRSKESQNQPHYRRTRRYDKPTSASYPQGDPWWRSHLVQSTPRQTERLVHLEIQRRLTEFSRCLIRSALIRWYWDQDVFISNHKSMTLHIFLHSKLKRAEAITLLDSGATENFINISYAQKLGLPIWRLTHERRLFNMDRIPN